METIARTAQEFNYLNNLRNLNLPGLALSYLGNKITDFVFPPAGASELSEDELNILRATGQLEDQRKKILEATGIGSGAAGVGEVPDLTNPDVLNQIAIESGLPTQKEGVIGFREEVATPGAASAIKSIQGMKRFKDPDTGQDLGFPVEDVIEFGPKDLTEEQIRSVYDMVQADQLPRTLAAEGGIMDLG